MEQGLYLFCLARLSRLPTPLEGVGLDGLSPLQLADYRELAAVWSPVPLADFCGPGATERLQDLNWIGPRVIRHQKVVAEVMQYSPVLPARFGAIFSSAASLERVLHQRHDSIAAFLERLTDQEEWAVKGLLHRPAAKERLVTLRLAREAERLQGLSPGRRYFLEQRLRAECDQELSRWVPEVYRELWNDFRGYATQVRERRLLSREATGGDQDMVLNWAFLVSEKSVPGFQTRVQAAHDRYADSGLELGCTGPWPPYSFCPALAPEPEA